MKSVQEHVPLLLADATFQQVAKWIKTPGTFASQSVDTCLKQIEDLNPKLNAFNTILAGEARAQAQEAEVEIRAGKWRGLFHGIPVGTKVFIIPPGLERRLASNTL